MLAIMNAKLQASRTLLYETARFVDMYKIYEDIARERKLNEDERAEMKHYSRLADALTPLAKGLGSEYCNQNAYDCIQIHGGSGFMKDYACERVYRDARITSIYEGTTQLQVVAAIRYVTTGVYKTLIDSYAAEGFSGALAPLAETLGKLTEAYQASVDAVAAVNEPKYLDFMARRLVEMAGDIIMGYLLLKDAKVCESFTDVATVYTKFVQAEVARHSDFIANFKLEQLAAYGI